MQAMPSHAPETTSLSSDDEAKYQQWVRDHNVPDGPNSHYDMRGYWKDIASQGRDETGINAEDHQIHYPDTYKQHDHPTFSAESQYSRGPQDGGQWLGETLVRPPIASHATTAAPMMPEPSHLPNAPMPFVRASSPIERVNSAIGNVYDAASNELKQLGPVGIFAQSLGADPSGVMQSWANLDQPMTAPLPFPGEPIKGVYSRIDEHVLNALKGTESPSRIKTLIGSMASPEEAQLRGLTEWLDTKPPSSRIDKSEVQAFLAAHPMPTVNEIQFGQRAYLDSDIATLQHKRDTHGLTGGEEDRLTDLEMERDNPSPLSQPAPRWDREDVNLPGGSQYREYVFTLPEKRPPEPVQPKVPQFQYAEPDTDRLMSTAHPSQIGQGPHSVVVHGYDVTGGATAGALSDGDLNGRIVEWPEGVGQRDYSADAIAGQLEDDGTSAWSTKRFQINDRYVQNSWHPTLAAAKKYLESQHIIREREIADRLNRNAASRLNYTSGHWSGIANPVAHLRMDDRVTVHGEPAALIQEGQSDLHQQAREVGYRDAVTQRQREAALAAKDKAAHAHDDALLDFKDTVERLGLANGLGYRLRSSHDINVLAHNLESTARSAGVKNGDLGGAMAQWRATTTDPLQEKDWAIGERGTLAEVNELQSAANTVRLRHAELGNAARALGDVNDNNAGVPDFPFKDTGWQKLTFNRALKDAVDRGKQWLLWTTGDQQAERYGNLLKNIKAVAWDPQNETVHVWNEAGQHSFDDITNEKDLRALIGDSATKRLLAVKPFTEHVEIPVGGTDEMVWSGHGEPTYKDATRYHGSPGDYFIDTRSEPLKITSAGMVQQYDTNWVNHANKIGKPYGAQVEKVPISNHVRREVHVTRDNYVGEDGLKGHIVSERFPDGTGQAIGRFRTREEANQFAERYRTAKREQDVHKVWGIKITPELKDRIQKGLPLFGLGAMSLLSSHDQDQK